MGIMSRLHWEIFCEPSPGSEYWRLGEQEHPEEERESEASLREAKEKELLVREKCARAAKTLRAKRGHESR